MTDLKHSHPVRLNGGHFMWVLGFGTDAPEDASGPWGLKGPRSAVLAGWSAGKSPVPGGQWVLRRAHLSFHFSVSNLPLSRSQRFFLHESDMTSS